MTNSGTDQDAVFDFVIPRGESGGTAPPEFLTAYSTPAQPGTSGSALIFDRNASSNGTAISHTEDSPDIFIQQTGYYEISFHGTISPASGVDFPLSILLALQQNRAIVPGSGARHNFQTTTDTSNLAFSQIIEVNTATTTLNVVEEGGAILYDDISITVKKIGEL